MMDIIIVLLALAFLMFVAFRGFSVILFAPIAAMFAVLMVSPDMVPMFFSGIFMEKLVGFVKLYFPVFLLGAIFGKMVEISGFSKSITAATIRLIGKDRAILAIVLVGAILTYGGVSLFVVAFAIYPFAAALFRAADIPKRLIPGTIALGAFTFTMDALPGSPQIQNIIPTTFFRTDTWAAPYLGTIGGIFICCLGITYLEWRRRRAALAGEGYGTGHTNEPADNNSGKLPKVGVAILPLLLVGVCNKLFTDFIVGHYGGRFDFASVGIHDLPPISVSKLSAVWAVQGALIVGILTVLLFSFQRIKTTLSASINLSVGGAMLAALNTASEYGFGAVIAALPGFKIINAAVGDLVQDPLLNQALSIGVLSGITGSASGGMSIALAAMGDSYLAQAAASGIDNQVLHRVAAMASGGMDTLPHNGAVITLFAITGLTHKQAYFDIFMMTIIKTTAVFIIIALYYLTGVV